MDDLKADELDLLAQVVPQVTKQDRIQVYKGVLKESIQTGNVDATNSLKSLQSIRQRLEIGESEHYSVLTELGIDNPTYLKPSNEYPQEERLSIASYKEAIASLLQELVGSGITPMMSMSRCICDTVSQVDIVFLHSASKAIANILRKT